MEKRKVHPIVLFLVLAIAIFNLSNTYFLNLRVRPIITYIELTILAFIVIYLFIKNN